MKNFSLKFIDIMVGLVLGLGFQWWPVLNQPWQYVAFIFVYLDIIDFWIDYGPSLKKWPPKREIDVLLDVAIMFALFLYIYSTQISLFAFVGAFILLRVLDFFWLLSSKIEFHPIGRDGTFLNTWLLFDCLEVIGAGVLIMINYTVVVLPLTLLLFFIGFRIAMRILASTRYKMAHFS